MTIIAKKKKIPSPRTIVQNAANTNAIKTNFLSFFNKNNNAVTPSKMYKGSVAPNREFTSILGSKIKKADAIKAYFCLINLVQI